MVMKQCGTKKMRGRHAYRKRYLSMNYCRGMRSEKHPTLKGSLFDIRTSSCAVGVYVRIIRTNEQSRDQLNIEQM